MLRVFHERRSVTLIGAVMVVMLLILAQLVVSVQRLSQSPAPAPAPAPIPAPVSISYHYQVAAAATDLTTASASLPTPGAVQPIQTGAFKDPADTRRSQGFIMLYIFIGIVVFGLIITFIVWSIKH